jgi:hypothetical protein
MKRMAVFVEGQTEQLFVERLVQEIAGAHRVFIDKKQGAGNRSARKFVSVEATSQENGQEYFILIYDCVGYTSVNSDIRDQYDSLAAKGYSTIVGMRDVHPDGRSDIAKLLRYMGYGVKTKPVQVTYVLAIMEIEAWFLAEHTHFQRINPGLTVELIEASLGFDPSVDNMELRDHPAEDLHQVYRLVGLAYNKRRNNALRTIHAVDYGSIYMDMASKIGNLATLIGAIDLFLS